MNSSSVPPSPENNSPYPLLSGSLSAHGSAHGSKRISRTVSLESGYHLASGDRETAPSRRRPHFSIEDAESQLEKGLHDPHSQREEKIHNSARGLTMCDRTVSADRYVIDLRAFVTGSHDNFEKPPATLKTASFPPPQNMSAVSEKGMLPFFATVKKEEDFVVNHHAMHIESIGDSNTDSLKDEKLKVGSTGEAGLKQGTSTFLQAIVNCVSLLFGLGILSSPYAVAKAGVTGAIISIVLAFSYWYTARLMICCIKKHPELSSYQDIITKVFGRKMRMLVASFFYIEILGTAMGYCISLGDNLSYIFPSSRLGLPGLTGRNFMMFISSLCILPTIWVRDLGSLSFATIWCIASTVVLLIGVILAATINGIGFSYPVPFLNINGVPVAAGLYAFSYGGTAVFPNVYKSMQDPSKFTQVMTISFIIATASCAGLGLAGAKMFGEATESQVTLSMPTRFVTTKIVLWMTVLTPITKFALLLSPLTTEVESRLPWANKSNPSARFALGTLARSLILALITIVAMVLPYFNYIVALIGSSMTICICMIFPCIFYMKTFYGSLRVRTVVTICVLMIFGALVAVAGTITSFKGLINSRSSKTG